MMKPYPLTMDLVQALRAEGYELPDETAEVRLVMPADGIFQLHYEVNVTGENLGKIGRAIARVADGDNRPTLRRILDE